MSTILVFMSYLIYSKEKWNINSYFSYMKSILSLFVKIRSVFFINKKIC